MQQRKGLVHNPQRPCVTLCISGTVKSVYLLSPWECQFYHIKTLHPPGIPAITVAFRDAIWEASCQMTS